MSIVVVFLIAALFMDGEDYESSVGLSMVDEASAQPEVQISSPWFDARIEHRRTGIYCEHTSSIPQAEEGLGINKCGVRLKLR